jgi:hypothetical protein
MSELDIKIREAECSACIAENLGFTEAVRNSVYFHDCETEVEYEEAVAA